MRQGSTKRPTVVARFSCMGAEPEAVARFFRQRHPEKTAESVAAATGMSLAASRKVLERQSTLSMINFLRCVSAYGPAFLIAVMPAGSAIPAWLDEAARAEESRRLRAEIDALTARLERAR